MGSERNCGRSRTGSMGCDGFSIPGPSGCQQAPLSSCGASLRFSSCAGLQQVGEGSGAHSGRRADLHSAGRARDLALGCREVVASREGGVPKGAPPVLFILLSLCPSRLPTDAFFSRFPSAYCCCDSAKTTTAGASSFSCTSEFFSRSRENR
jgi:hypothetical protein